MKKIISILLLLILPFILIGQNGSIIIKDNINIIMSGNINLITAQQSNQGIQKIGNLQGGIICDNEQSRVIWNILTNTGNYTIPFKISNTLIPFSVNITSAGVGAGKLLISTYHTTLTNTIYPNGYSFFSSVTNMDFNGVDNSNNVVDRFWIINYSNYSTIPISQFTMTYDASNDLNGIAENDLQAQYWDGISWTLPTIGISDPLNDNVNSILNINKNAPWVLVNKLSPLPIELYSFIANCDNNNINIKWSTMSETNNDYFVLWKSYDGVDFEIIGQIDGAGNSNSYLEYEFSYQDIIENIYYKLQQIDYDGNNTYSDVISVNCEQNIGYAIVPNPSIDGNFHVYGVDSDDEISVFDVIGKRCNNEILESGCYTVFVNKEFIGKLIVK